MKDFLLIFINWCDKHNKFPLQDTEATVVEFIDSLKKTDQIIIYSKETIDSVIKILSNHSYSQDDLNAIGENVNNVDDGFAYDHAVCVKLLGENTCFTID